MKNLLFLFIYLFFAASYTLAQGTTYYSQATGDFNTLANWNSERTGGGEIPITFADNTFIVQNTHLLTISGDITLHTIIIEDGGVVDAGIYLLSTNIFDLQDGSEFIQGGSIQSVPGTNRTLAPTSTFRFNGTQAGLANTDYPEFGNLIWEPTPSSDGVFQNSDYDPPFLNGLVVRGNLTINIQGTEEREIRFADGSTISRIHQIDGSLFINSAVSKVVIQDGSSITSTVNIIGDLIINAGTLQGLSSTTTNGGNAIINLGGNLTNVGIINVGNSTGGTWTLNLSGYSSPIDLDAGPINSFQNINSVGKVVTLRSDINLVGNGTYNVNGGMLQCLFNIIKGDGNFILGDGSSIRISSPDGITSSGSLGNIQVNGIRTFSPKVIYRYRNLFDPIAQVTGNGLPVFIGGSNPSAFIIENPEGVTLSQSTTVQGNISLFNGKLYTGPYQLNMIGGGGLTTNNQNYIIGNFGYYINYAGPFLFGVGTSIGYTPVTLSNVVGIFDTFKVSVHEGKHPNRTNENMLGMYWTLTNNSIEAANITFNYLDSDVNGNEENYRLLRFNGVGFDIVPATINTIDNTVTVSGVTQFSDFTLGEMEDPQTLTLIKPYVNQVTYALETTEITWSSQNIIGGITLRLSTDGGATYPFTLIENTINDGSETVTLPDVKSISCRIRIESYDIPNVFDETNGNFVITGRELFTLKYYLPKGAYKTAIGDINQDGSTELAVGYSTGENSYVTIYSFNSMTQMLDSIQSINYTDPWIYPLIGDADNDGTNELIVTTNNGDIGSYLRIYRYSGTNVWTEVWSNQYYTIRYPNAVNIGDVDNDGQNEISVGVAWNTGGLYVLEYTGNNIWENSLVTQFSNTSSTFIGDCDNDGLNDLLAGTIGSGWQIYKWNGSSYSLNTSSQPMALVGATIGDTDNDGLNEVISRSEVTPEINYGETNLKIYKWDGVSYVDQWSWNSGNSVTDPVIGNLSGTKKQIAAFSGRWDSRYTAADSRLHIFEKTTDSYQQIWQSGLFSNPNLGESAIGNVDGIQGNELVFTHNVDGVFIYGAESTNQSSPTLSWAGGPGLGSDGVDPNIGTTSSNFIFRIIYTDADGDAPQSGYPKIHVLKNNEEIIGSPFNMTETYVEPTWRRYSFEKNDFSLGTDYSYYFEAFDINGNPATGEPTIQRNGPLVYQQLYDINTFNSITLSQIANTSLNGAEINGNDNADNQLNKGAIILFRTNLGRYGKFIVQDYRYNLTLNWVTYNSDGSIYNSGENFVVQGTWSVDLDEGLLGGFNNDVDFFWNQQTDIERKILPMNDALFAVYTSLNHFAPVWSGNPYLPMNIYITAATNDGIDLGAGDEIGVFDGEHCVGSIVLTEPIPPSGYISIIASTDDPTTPEVDGFVPGHTITYRLWDSNNSREITRVNLSYTLGDGTFSSQGTALLSLAGIYTISQNVPLNTGWNILSLTAIPDNTNMLQLLDPLISSSVLVKVQDERGYAVEQLPVIGWINNIGNWQATEGYYMRLNGTATLNVIGPPITLPLNIPLTNGWNIIGYPLLTEENALGVLDPLIVANQLIKVQDEAGNAVEQLPIIGWINNIGNFKSGEGYYLKVNTNTSLTFNQPIVNPRPAFVNIEKENKELNSLLVKPTANHFIPIYSSPYLPMNIYITSATLIGGESLGAGDEIGIFDGNNCVGAFALTEPIGSYISMIASTDDPTTPAIDGFIPGHTISYRFWLSSIATEITSYTANYILGNGTFSSQGTAMLNFTNVLPVELISFIASSKSNSINLQWETATEVNNYGFEIERKVNTIWEKIGFVAGYGNSNSPKSYSFTDNNIVGGSKFQYRLKQIDNDGQFEYSEIVEVELTPNEYALYQNYPNPFNPVTKVRFAIPFAGKVIMKLYNSIGEEVMDIINQDYDAGYHEVEINLGQLASGIYLYKIVSNDFTSVKKLIIMK